MKTNIILSILALSLLALSLYYRAEGIETELACQKTLTEINETSEANRKAEEVKNNVIETKRVEAEQIANERGRLLAERLQRDKSRVQNNPNNSACRITPIAYGVLREAVSDSRIPQAPDPAGPVNPPVPAPNAGQ
jgi:hypothetical protein